MVDKSELKIGLFGGSFDPIHFGHLNLAIEIFEHEKLDKILFCPAGQNPFKKIPTTPAQHRLEMLKLALEGLPHFEILSWELEREGPSYTVDTLKMLSQEYQNIFLILGQDSLNELPQWKDPDEIHRLATVLSGPRFCSENTKPGYRVVEVSSTELRERLEKRLYCRHLMPKNVVDYIHAHHLYLPTDYG